MNIDRATTLFREFALACHIPCVLWYREDGSCEFGVDLTMLKPGQKAQVERYVETWNLTINDKLSKVWLIT